MIGLSRSTRQRLLTRQHLGTVHGEDYVAAIKGLELPRKGLIHRFSCARFCNRTIELRSDSELCVFMEYYFQRDVADIREHVPLFTSHTTEIAVQHGLPHPGGIETPAVLLTDLVVTRQIGGAVMEEAVQTRHADCALTPAFSAECALQEIYWRQCGASFSICCRRGVDSPLARNLCWLFPTAEQAIRTGVTQAQQLAQAVLLEELTCHDHADVRQACRAAARRGSLPPGAAVCAFRQLLAMQVLAVDLSARDLFCLSPAAFTIVALRSPA